MCYCCMNVMYVKYLTCNERLQSDDSARNTFEYIQTENAIPATMIYDDMYIIKTTEFMVHYISNVMGQFTNYSIIQLS